MNQIEPAREAFIDAWASMASLFSFSPSTARVCGLLITLGEPISPSEISERLGLSRGNVSMCLKELRSWGVARRAPQAGDRQDFYVSDGEIWNMALGILRERKRREFDPTLHEALLGLEGLKHDEHASRASEIETFLRTLDRVSTQLLAHPDALPSLMGLIGRGEA